MRKKKNIYCRTIYVYKMTPKDSKHQYEIHEEAFVCQQSAILGVVVVGKGSVIHPACVINAGSGRIEIGCNNIIEEQVEITNTKEGKMVIGNYNIIEVGSKITDVDSIGNSNVFETKCEIHEGAKIGNGCTVGVLSIVPPGEVMEDESVIYGTNSVKGSEPGALEQHELLLARHVEILREILPKSHYSKRARGGGDEETPPLSHREHRPATHREHRERDRGGDGDVSHRDTHRERKHRTNTVQEPEGERERRHRDRDRTQTNTQTATPTEQTAPVGGESLVSPRDEGRSHADRAERQRLRAERRQAREKGASTPR
eukprot:GHVR01173632.1.p1 GENE.GHVR01173632.1~~GHVR01173632.1.p1  ORF type:complete len:315 (-),score=79.95 GHVR01173632.1:354-1298(-)